MKKLLSLTVLNNLDPIPLALGPVKRPAPQPKPTLTSVPGKPHLFMDAAGRMQYLPPEPPKEAKPKVAAPQPTLRKPMTLDDLVPDDTAPALHGFKPGQEVSADEARALKAQGVPLEFMSAVTSKWRPSSLDVNDCVRYRIAPGAEPPAPAPTTEDVWLDTPPPAKGWYCASSQGSKNAFRWWDGACWSQACNSTHSPQTRQSRKAKSSDIPIRWNPSVTVPWSD